MTTPSPLLAEAMALSGWDTVTFDLQHGMISLDAAATMISSVGRVAPCVLRAPSLSYSEIGFLLDAGADGIICPMIENKNQAEALVAACRYPPGGRRSYGPSRLRLLRPGDDTNFDKYPIILAMIETAAGLQNVDDVLATCGLDGVFIGPADLGLSLGYGSDVKLSSDALRPIVEELVQKAHSYKKVIGIFIPTTPDSISWSHIKFDFLAIGSDIQFVKQASSVALQALEEYKTPNQVKS